MPDAPDAELLWVGWEEWVGLPDLGLAAVKAKVDTGAKTSALHALEIDTFGPVDRPRVRFVTHPLPEGVSGAVVCAASVVDRRDVTSSNGETERRFVIETAVVLGPRSWPIEVTLTDRDTMSYRMLFGRAAMRGIVAVDPARAFIQGAAGPT